MIRLQVLGPLQLSDATGRELRTVTAQPKRLALLVYLAVVGGFQRRDRLLAMFWPELDTAHARGALNQAVRFLRRELGDSAGRAVASRGDEELGVDPSAIWCDATAFAAELSAAHYGEALELYRGDILDGFFVEAAAEFDEWLDSERARLRASAGRAARAAAEAREADGRVTTAVSSARRALELSHPDERAMRELLELLDRLGDRAGALHAYEVFETRVARELETSPSPETVALVERIRSGAPRRERPLTAPATDAASSPAPGPPTDLERWSVERELARGGMGTVYLGRDRKHDRPVAIKMLRPELLVSGGADRFLREIQITASLAHPHILPLIDSGTSSGTFYLVTPFIAGESLRGRLRRESQFAVAVALRIAREIADALDYAHRRGIVHRDIKPENILLADGHALVADFGVARAAMVSGGADADSDTEPDGIAGTPTYLSPEEAAGDASSGVRSDVYSLGLVLHEMLTGVLPRCGDSARDVRARRSEIPTVVAQLVSDCIARDPAHRPATAALVNRALTAAGERLGADEARLPAWWRGPQRRLVVAGVAIIAVAVSGGYLAARSASLDPKPRVMLVPFRNMTGDPGFEHFGNTVSSSIASALAKVRTVELIPIGRSNLKRRYTVTGSFYRRGDSLEFRTEIVDNLRQRALPSPATVRVHIEDPLASSTVISHRALGALAYYTSVFGVDSAAERRPPAYEAYVAFADGLAARLRNFGDTSPELRFRRAIALDPSYTEAYFLLTSTFANQPGRAFRRGGVLGRFEAMDSLAREMRQAIAPMTTSDHFLLDFVEGYAAGDIDKAMDATVRLSERMPAANFTVGFMGVLANRPWLGIRGLDRLDPDAGWAREWWPYWTQLTAAQHQAREYRAELRAAERARERFPHAVRLLDVELRARIALGELNRLSTQDLAPIDVLRLALELRAHGHVARSKEWMTAIVDSAPPGEMAFPDRIWLSMALLALDRLGEGIAILERSVRLDSLALDQWGMLGTAYARQGRREEANRISQQLASVAEPYLHGLPTLWRAKIAARLGNRDVAVDLLAQAFDEGVWFHPLFPYQRGSFWHTDPDFESLRGYGRYEDLIRPR